MKDETFVFRECYGKMRMKKKEGIEGALLCLVGFLLNFLGK